MDLTLTDIGWATLIVFQIFLAAYFFRLYLKDKNKRKLMFAFGFFIISYSHLYELITPSLFGQSPVNIFTALQYWSFFPLIFAIGIAIHKKIFETIDSNKVFYIFLGLTFASLSLILNPSFAISYSGLIAILLGLEIVIMSLYNYIKNRGFGDFIFLFALLCYLNAGSGLIGFWNIGTAIFGFFIGNALIILVFHLPYDECVNKSYIKDYFTVRDELVKIKQALNEREQTFQTLFNDMADPVVIIGKQGKFLEITQRIKEYTGYDKKELIGRNFLDTQILTETSKQKCKINLSKRMNGEEIGPYEIEIRTKDKITKPFEINAQPIMYRGSQAEMVIFRDITERKKMQKKADDLLKNSLFLSQTANDFNRFNYQEDLFKYIASKIGEITGNCLIVISSYNSQTSKFSIEYVEGLRSSMEKISNFLGMNLTDYSKIIDNKHWKDILSLGKILRLQPQDFKTFISPYLPRGSYRFVVSLFNLNEIYAMGMEEGGIVFGSIILIAKKNSHVKNIETIETFVNQAAVAMQRNKAMKELSDMNKNLEDLVNKRTERIGRLLKQKDEFIDQLGHDLKNPLGPLLNLLPLLQKNFTDKNEREMFDVVQRNVDYMKNLVIKTLELARLNSPNNHIHTTSVNITDTMKDMIENNSFLFHDHGIHLKNNIKDDIIIEADEILLEELFTNIINNAVKYSPQGGTISIDVQTSSDTVTLSICDQGIGMSPDQIQHVFDEFYKADGSRHDFDSSGLGMPIAKRIVEKHGGKIWVDSEGIGKGSTVFIQLPHQTERNMKKDSPDSYSTISEKVDRLIILP
jgi:PAS domain S-box-containing protein